MFGKRRLAQWIRRPLASKPDIEARTEAVAELAGVAVPAAGGNQLGDVSGGAPYCTLELLEVMAGLPDLEKGFVCGAGCARTTSRRD